MDVTSDGRQTIRAILLSVQRDLERALGEVRDLDASATELQGRLRDFERQKADATRFLVEEAERGGRGGGAARPTTEDQDLVRELVASADMEIDRLIAETRGLKAARQERAEHLYGLERQKLALMSQIMDRLRSSATGRGEGATSLPSSPTISHSASSFARPADIASPLAGAIRDEGPSAPVREGVAPTGSHRPRHEGTVNPIPEPPDKRCGTRPYKARPGGEAPRGFAAAVRGIAHKSIAEAGRPLQREAIVDDVTASGIPLPTSFLPQKVSKILAMDRELMNERGKGYSLRPEALERAKAAIARDRDDAPSARPED